MQISRFRLLLAAALAWAAYTPPAAAYIDPTAAGAALQSAYVVVASALMTLALVPKKVAAMFARVKAILRPGATKDSDS
jgi:hypothetical protein